MAVRIHHSNRPVRPSSAPAKRKGIPLSPLAQQMLHDMQLAGLSDRTHESYLRAVRKFAQWLDKSPSVASENDSKAVGDGRHALKYLAPYVFRVALSNRRIVKCEPGPGSDPLADRVTFTYRKGGSQRYRRMTVTAEEFIRRFLQHVLPRGFQKVRHYGFAHPRRQIETEWLQMLVTLTLNMVYVLIVKAQPLRVTYGPACPDCGAALKCIGFIPADDRLLGRSPFDTS